MKALFDEVSVKCSELTTKRYSTSFSFGIRMLDKRYHDPIYAIYGFVRFADEIVDTFHDFNKEKLLNKFQDDTYEALDEQISLNPILNAFQKVVHEYGIDRALIDQFLNSMRMDLDQTAHDRRSYEKYILGSAEVVGLMCLKVFVDGNEKAYAELRPAAMKLGAAFQKVNFLRDMQADFEGMGRTYFPGIDLTNFDYAQKQKIEEEINQDFKAALKGIRKLPPGARRGVYLAYIYYRKLFNKIRNTPPEQVMNRRIRIANGRKLGLMFNTMLRHQFNVL